MLIALLHYSAPPVVGGAAADQRALAQPRRVRAGRIHPLLVDDHEQSRTRAWR
jgi:hypothetical protein